MIQSIIYPSDNYLGNKNRAIFPILAIKCDSKVQSHRNSLSDLLGGRQLIEVRKQRIDLGGSWKICKLDGFLSEDEKMMKNVEKQHEVSSLIKVLDWG